MEKEHSQTFPLMDLPAEIRTMILKELLIMPGPVHFKDLVYPSKSLKKKEKRWRSKFAPFAAMEPVRYHTLTEGPRQWHYIDVKKTTIIKQSSLLNLFLASRAIYSEAMPIYFGCNLFEFDSLDRFKPFISGIGAEKRSQLRHLKVTWSTGSGRTAGLMAKLLYQCTALQDLTLRLNHKSTTRPGKNSPYKLQLWGMRELLKLRGLTKLDIDIPSNLQCYTFWCDHVPQVAQLGASHAWWKQPDIDALVERFQVLKQPRVVKVCKGKAKQGAGSE